MRDITKLVVYVVCTAILLFAWMKVFNYVMASDMPDFLKYMILR